MSGIDTRVESERRYRTKPLRVRADGNTVLYYKQLPGGLPELRLTDPVLPGYLDSWREYPADHRLRNPINLQLEIRDLLQKNRPVFGFTHPVDWEILKQLLDTGPVDCLEELYQQIGSKEDEEITERAQALDIDRIAVTGSLDYFCQGLYANETPISPELTDCQQQIYSILKQEGRAMKPPEIAEHSDFSRRTVQRHASTLSDMQVINRKETGHTHVLYYTDRVPRRVESVFSRRQDLVCAKEFLQNGNYTEYRPTIAAALEDVLHYVIEGGLFNLHALDVPTPNDIELLTSLFEWGAEQPETASDLAQKYFDAVEETVTPVDFLSVDPEKNTGEQYKASRSYFGLAQSEIAEKVNQTISRKIAKSTTQQRISRIEQHSQKKSTIHSETERKLVRIFFQEYRTQSNSDASVFRNDSPFNEFEESSK